MKVTVNHSVVITVQAQGNLEFGQQFLDKISDTIKLIAESYRATSFQCVPNKKEVRMEFTNVALAMARKLKDEVMRKVTLLAEHGPNVDILNAFLDRYPELCAHPDLNNIVGAFENLNRVLQDVQKDSRNSLKAQIQQREQAGVTLIVGDLEASQGTKADMTPEQRAEFRASAILGHTAEQVEAAKRVVRQDAAGLPGVYKKAAAAQKAADPEAVGDHGNVFTTPAKGTGPATSA